tara:strand:- start:1242 stop:1916 length:675 start_codon:yes stop_codon:yes gene_type:complete
MKVVKVYGALKKRLGGQGRFEFVANTPAEAMRALCANFPGLDKWLIDSEQNGIYYKVAVGKEKITEDKLEDLQLPWSEKAEFRITPVLTGAGRGGFWGVVTGAALIGASFLFPGAGAFGTTSFFGSSAVVAGTAGATAMGVMGTAIGTGLSLMGASMVLGGVSQMISPRQPSGLGRSKEAAKLQNYSFSGITNTAQQGMAVPIVYGRCFVGSAVISSGLDVDQL